MFNQMVEHRVATEPLDDTLGALADPTRRAILARLSLGEARVTEVAAPFEMSLNAVSKHIRVLEGAGLVRRRKAGRDHFLSIDPAPLDEAAAWLDARRREWNTRFDLLETILREPAPEMKGHTSGNG